VLRLRAGAVLVGTTLALTDEFGDSKCGDVASDVRVVVSPVEVKSADPAEEPVPCDFVENLGQDGAVVVVRPVGGQPIGMPAPSVAIDHFQPVSLGQRGFSLFLASAGSSDRTRLPRR
jgi:hypothetical protein